MIIDSARFALEENTFSILWGLFHFVNVRLVSFNLGSKLFNRSRCCFRDAFSLLLQHKDVPSVNARVSATRSTSQALEADSTRVFEAHVASRSDNTCQMIKISATLDTPADNTKTRTNRARASGCSGSATLFALTRVHLKLSNVQQFSFGAFFFHAFNEGIQYQRSAAFFHALAGVENQSLHLQSSSHPR